jgi:hypothetical protein
MPQQMRQPATILVWPLSLLDANFQLTKNRIAGNETRPGSSTPMNTFTNSRSLAQNSRKMIAVDEEVGH